MSDESSIGSGTLIAIGGHEQKTGDRPVLRAVAEAVGDGRLIVAALASREPAEYIETYGEAFADLLARPAVGLTDDPAEAADQLRTAGGVFFTGGDQRRLLDRLRDADLIAAVRDLVARGGVVAGTSAGASAIGERMLAGAPGDESYRIGMGEFDDGLDLLHGVVIDQHFAERGRIGRLMGAVAAAPQQLGIGIDEDTAVIARGSEVTVIGSGAVWIVDGTDATHSTIRSGEPDQPLSLFDTRVHVLSPGDRFDLGSRRPAPGGSS
jgi:cyanophycinase